MNKNDAIEVRPLAGTDRAWAEQVFTTEWGATLIIAHGTPYDLMAFPGFVAWRGAERIGLITYRLDGKDCEVMSLNSLVEKVGAGGALLAAVQAAARAAGCQRLWLITTNDNLHAIRFYQRRGFVLAALHRDAVTAARRLKPAIPLIGLDDIPLRDEIELEMAL